MSTPKLYEEAQAQLAYFDTQTKSLNSIIRQKDSQLLELQISWDQLSDQHEEVSSSF